MPGKILRSSMYRHGWDKQPVTVVVRARDLRTSPEKAAEEMEAVSPGAFVVSDIFEVDDEVYNDPVKATFAGMRRLDDSARLDTEMNMALCYYWNANALDRLNSGGVLTSTRPAPLTEDQLSIVLRQLSRHPNYKQQRIMQYARNGRRVTFHDGKIEVEEK